MGRQKGRKRRRRARASLGAEALRRSEERRRRRSTFDPAAETAALAPFADDVVAGAWRDRGPRSLVAMAREDARGAGATPALTCEGCHEFIPGDTGRGRCLHPGSGVLAPWPDTEACQFHEARRRR